MVANGDGQEEGHGQAARAGPSAVPWPALADALSDLMNDVLTEPLGAAQGGAAGRTLSTDDRAFLLDIVQRHDVGGSHLETAPAPAPTLAGGPPAVTLLGFKVRLSSPYLAPI